MKNNYLSIQAVLKGAFSLLCLTFFSNNAQGQSDYSVTPIPYQIYTATSAVQGTMDDTFSAPIPLGFNFDFYGTLYSSVNVSTNGYISFTPQTQGSFSPWTFNQAIPNANFPAKNSLLGCFHDLNNSNAEGTITYSIIGTAPYRRLVVLFNNQSHFSCTQTKSSFQMVLYETLNIMDVQIIDKGLCSTWNSGNSVTGIIDQTGLQAVTPPGRNTGQWAATQEGWRFQRPISTNTYLFAKCDDDTDGLVSFNLQVVQNDLSAADPLLVSFYSNEQDAISQTNAFVSLNYTNTANNETIYANVNGEIKTVVLRVVDCAADYDLDSVATADEDLNADTNLANDDTDADGIPNFIDNDDDGDLILTAVEYVFQRSANAALAYLDTDNDGILNYLDNDDDGDGILTIMEDANQNNNPADDDVNGNNVPDYLEFTALAIDQFIKSQVTIFPNPASSVLNIENKSTEAISSIAIYNLNGAVVKEIKSSQAALQTIPVAELNSGVYFVKVELKGQVVNFKFVKK
ncbi:T9SS type A sorting domain-containing protein [Flavobacterium sp. CYK-4]|uniref:T9SS type A sorting domain-containing protein n=1 Tax=Flavobacterium lotistagni TaxID=2709660 RepID=UPI00140E1219|nr:T9SS type A sorting domain-containing protein [Flavobacterium lotistagni]NHM06384.1 T9SS type A sorting domain-containing protein [Flavobacterium lotistagni]